MEKEERPCVLSEYGGDGCPIPGHTMKARAYGYHALSPEEFPAAFEKKMKEIQRLAEEGLSAAVWTQLSDIEEEINGLLTYDRKVCKVKS